MTRFCAATADAFYSGQSSTSYATARGTGNYTAAGSYIRVGQWLDSSWYIIDRGMLLFDTSSIPDGDTVTAVNLGVCIAVDGTVSSDFIMYCYKYNWDSTKGTDNVYDMGTAGASDAAAAVKETPEIDVTGKVAGNWLEFTGLTTSWVNKTGNTRYALRSNRDADGSGTAPTGKENLSLYAGDHTESYRPYLDVTHGTLMGSRVTRFFATGILADSPMQQL